MFVSLNYNWALLETLICCLGGADQARALFHKTRLLGLEARR